MYTGIEKNSFRSELAEAVALSDVLGNRLVFQNSKNDFSEDEQDD